MADSAFTSQDIDDLAQKLTQNPQLLTPRERQLLLAVFAAAGDNVQKGAPSDGTPAIPAGAGPAELTAEELEDQLLRSFTPGALFAEADTHAKHPLKIVGR